MTSKPLSILIDHLFRQTLPDEVCRLFHGRGRCFPGLEHVTVDWLQGQILVSLFKEHEPTWVETLKSELQTLMTAQTWADQVSAVILQHRYISGAPIDVVYGALSAMPVVNEQGLKFGLSVGANQNMGLFLDMRLGRQWVKSQAKDKRILNLFSYTCGFSVAALTGGADHVVNLDMSKAALKQGKANHKLNGHDLTKVTFLGHELFKSWGKVKKLGPYDLIIIDPPSFQKGSFALTKDYQRILRRLEELLTERGTVLACVNSPQVSAQFLIDEMAREAPQMQFDARLPNPPEFPDIDEDSNLKCLVFNKETLN
ncbi:class I SAM-dependent methyltransferase [Pseudoalteromonas sp. OOF1S-7]|uniref:class I SAM-dependent methyltransferase n=1 Tax=Pseudoalteromonas sp. OOF1S-7 TaxID=2917757 RepID=UPI001EF71F1A|nr:class I SAM-dependent methyltransferase [Pseudoalteromonas sp. OOF1S-7]MCG7534309.1 class I SAM-dependent methyltransferase [Pseudoalteromonas sp. OOF1S-7]